MPRKTSKRSAAQLDVEMSDEIGVYEEPPSSLPTRRRRSERVSTRSTTVKTRTRPLRDQANIPLPTAKRRKMAMPVLNLVSPPVTRQRSGSRTASQTADEPAATNAPQQARSTRRAKKTKKRKVSALEAAEPADAAPLEQSEPQVIALDSDDDEQADAAATSSTPIFRTHFTLDEELEELRELAELMEKQEDQYSVSPAWITFHPSLRASMRSVLLDWLRECAEGYKLSRTTYQTAVNIFDRFMSDRFRIPRDKVQLIGAAVLLIAGKMEESYRSPTVGSLLFYCDGLYKRSELLRVEALILKVLHWRVSAPTPHVHAKLILTRDALQSMQLNGAQSTSTDTVGNGYGYGVPRKDCSPPVGLNALLQKDVRKVPFDTDLMTRAMRLLDVAMLDIECLKYRSSMLARCSLVVAESMRSGRVEYLKSRLAAYSPLPLTSEDQQQTATSSDIDPSTPALTTTPIIAAGMDGNIPETIEQRRCCAWMLHYTHCVLPTTEADSEPEPGKEPYEIQDWDSVGLGEVRKLLRRRAEVLPPDPQRALAFGAPPRSTTTEPNQQPLAIIPDQ